jgi:predicted amidohydrolase YtcJ
MEADLVLYNGVVHTMDRCQPSASAVAIQGNRILAVGDDSDLLELLRPGGRRLDLAGQTVLPGLTDAHIHFATYALGLKEIQLDGVSSRAEAVARVAQRIQQAPPGDWITGHGWNQNLWQPPELPTAADLDAVSPNHPVVLTAQSIHSAWVNSRALARAGITTATPDPPGGEIVRDANGQPTGILLETAMELVTELLDDPSPQALTDALREGIRNAHALGLTGIHDPGEPDAFRALQALQASGELQLRVLMHLPKGELEAAIAVGLRSGFGSPSLRIGGVKLFTDGALGVRTAHMLAPYDDVPGHTGLPTLTRPELLDLVRRARQAGLSATIHAIGDAANRTVLDVLETAHAEPVPTPPSLPDRIEHVQLLHPDDVSRFARLRVVASMQPIHAPSDMEMAQRGWGARCRWAYAWNSLLAHNTPLAFGSDCPVESLDPLAGIHAAVTRRRADGAPGPEGWIPEERVTVAQAVYAYTLGAAYASGEIKLKGSVTPGKLADLTVLSRDLFDAEPDEIPETEVMLTVFDGNIVYHR